MSYSYLFFLSALNVKLRGRATITENLMIKIKTIVQIQLFENGAALLSPSQATCSLFYVQYVLSFFKAN